MKLTAFKHELRMNYHYDKWGEVMSAWFEACAHLRYRNKVCIPSEWGYTQPSTYDPRDKESYYFSIFRKCSDRQLLAIGHFLNRLSQFLDRKGLSY